ncbi:MAG: terpene cyclase/mutase family protein [Gimesia sp.]|nr:terpene cyclase/mutase family protein [Gimesia sp.]
MIALSSLVLAVSLGALPADSPTTIQIRQTVQRSIPYIEEQGQWWITTKKCVSCHRGGNMVWSLSVAKRNGFKVSEKLDEWFDWAVEKSLSKNKKEKVVGLGNKEGVAQILLSLDSSNLKPDQSETRKKLAVLLRNGQQADGSWKPGGQLPSQKRPITETASVSTMWLTLTLLIAGNSTESSQAVDRAMKYIKQSTPGKSIEWYALRLLLAVQTKDFKLRDEFVKKLRSQQKPNGGWGWMVTDESDALGTGLALYALLRAGLDSNDQSIKRAQQFLLSTQRDDGSWPVKGTKEKKKNNVEETAVFWGTTWAVVGLIESLPKQSE